MDVRVGVGVLEGALRVGEAVRVAVEVGVIDGVSVGTPPTAILKTSTAAWSPLVLALRLTLLPAPQKV